MSRWPLSRLKFLASAPIKNGLGEKGEFDDPSWPRYIRTTDIASPTSLRDDTFKSLPFAVAKDAMLSSGDILMTAAGATIGKSFRFTDSYPACFAGYLVRFRPAEHKVNGRFVAYWMQSATYWAQVDAQRVKSTIENFSASRYQGLEVPVPPLPTQRAIADYLDSETARIDALIEKKRRIVDLTLARCSQVLQSAMSSHGFTIPSTLEPDWSQVDFPSGWYVLHMNQALLQLTNGFVGPTRDILFDEGIRYVQSLHIKNGAIDFERRPFFVDKAWHDARPRVHLRPEDVLIVQTGDIGQVAVVPPDFGEASCHALQIARVRSEIVSGSYLGEYLRTPFGYHSLLKRATGALHPHLEGGIRDVPVVVPPRAVQDSLVEEATRTRRQATHLVEKLGRQIDLLIEHRQAIITAAVTGDLPIPGVAA